MLFSIHYPSIARAIGNVIGVKAKTIRNRYPLSKAEKEEPNTGTQPVASGTKG